MNINQGETFKWMNIKKNDRLRASSVCETSYEIMPLETTTPPELKMIPL